MNRANQKRFLDNMVITEGEFTTEFFSRMDWRDMLSDEFGEHGNSIEVNSKESGTELTEKEHPVEEPALDVRKALAAAEDEEDAAAARLAEGEMALDDRDFVETAPSGPITTNDATPAEQSGVVNTPDVTFEEIQNDETGLEGTIDGYMLSFVELYWDVMRDI